MEILVKLMNLFVHKFSYSFGFWSIFFLYIYVKKNLKNFLKQHKNLWTKRVKIKVKCFFCVSTTICISKYFLMLFEFFLFINKCSLNIFLYILLLLLLLIHFFYLFLVCLFIFHKIKQTMCFVRLTLRPSY